MGTPDFAVPALEALAGRHEVVAVYAQPARPSGRGQKARPGPVAWRAEALGIPVRTPLSLRTAEAVDELRSFSPDVAVVAAYGLILPQAILDVPTLGCLNIHASLLPRWRGAAPIQRAIMAGDAETGVCIMRMEAGLDTGPVLLRSATRIGPHDTAGSLHDRLGAMGAEAIVDALARIGTLATHPQPDEGVTYAAKIEKSETRVDWSLPATRVDRLIRGMAPFPGAWTEIGGGRVKLLLSETADGSGVPGEVIGDLVIACGEGAVRVLEVQRAGRGVMDAASFLRGTPVARGTILA